MQSDETSVRLPLAQQQTRIAHIEADLERLRRTAKTHRQGRDLLQESINFNRSSLAPMHSLPFEILAMVFVECVEDPENLPPRILALVCQRWRDILYQTPRVWYRVTCVARDETRPLTTSFRNLRRAGKSPIVVQIDFRNANHRRSWKDWSVILASALGGNPWRSLDIVCPDKSFLPDSIMPFISHLAESEIHPYMVSLTFRAGTNLGTMRSQHRLVLSDAFQKLPSLRSLRIPVQWLKESHVILDQLETLELDCACQYPRVLVYADFLHKCSNVKYLKLPPCDCGIYPAHNRPAFDMVNLNELRMSFIIPGLLAQARMPNLRTLFIENSRNWDYEIYAYAMQLLNEDRGKSQITKLVVSSTRCSNRTLLWILKRLETLKELQISACKVVRYVPG
ncbi:hypothetical protein FRC04_008095 [Tulasnella sp. 424]|nr:hypothetical protein FRC04_008095 [Tulasnella sp. 424]KAG8974752.1 hypothetical protein FRC05_006912 [Tulasnella sp. 425]